MMKPFRVIVDLKDCFLTSSVRSIGPDGLYQFLFSPLLYLTLLRINWLIILFSSFEMTKKIDWKKKEMLNNKTCRKLTFYLKKQKATTEWNHEKGKKMNNDEKNYWESKNLYLQVGTNIFLRNKNLLIMINNDSSTVFWCFKSTVFESFVADWYFPHSWFYLVMTSVEVVGKLFFKIFFVRLSAVHSFLKLKTENNDRTVFIGLKNDHPDGFRPLGRILEFSLFNVAKIADWAELLLSQTESHDTTDRRQRTNNDRISKSTFSCFTCFLLILVPTGTNQEHTLWRKKRNQPTFPWYNSRKTLT